MTRTETRTRHMIGMTTAKLVSPLFRYSVTRDAYVLRGVGNRTGPVLKIGTRPKVEEPPPPQSFA